MLEVEKAPTLQYGHCDLSSWPYPQDPCTRHHLPNQHKHMRITCEHWASDIKGIGCTGQQQGRLRHQCRSLQNWSQSLAHMGPAKQLKNLMSNQGQGPFAEGQMQRSVNCRHHMHLAAIIACISHGAGCYIAIS